MFEVGDPVRTVSKVTQKDYDALKRNGIKPGTLGEITGIMVIVNFNGVTVGLDESSVEYEVTSKPSSTDYDGTLDHLKNMFGFK
jgi:hypothetical protein